MNKEEYSFLKSIGLCPVCKRKNYSKRYVVCVDCREERAKYYKEKYKSEECKQKKLSSDMKRYNENKKNGICVSCGKNNAESGMVRCHICLEKNKIRNRKAYNKKVGMTQQDKNDNRICIRCNNPVYNDFKLCKEHYDALNSRNFKAKKYRHDDFAKEVYSAGNC